MPPFEGYRRTKLTVKLFLIYNSNILHNIKIRIRYLPEHYLNTFQCEICISSIAKWEQPIMMSCKHAFCKNCWESYLTIKILDGNAHHIMCPAYQCHILVPVELIEKLVSPEMARRYLQFDIKVSIHLEYILLKEIT